MTDTLLVTSRDLEELVQRVGLDRLMDELLTALTDALSTYDETATQVIKRAGFTYDRPHPGVLEWMPAMVVGDRAVIKVVSYNPINPSARGIPTIVSTISLYDIATGRLLALVDGILPTALRTGAASAVATRILARRGSAVIGLVGCGAQAVTQLHALSRCFEIRTVLAYDIDDGAGRSLAGRTAFLDLPVRLVPRDVLERESDIICTATSVEPGAGPVIADGSLTPWVHINAVGSDLPGKTEVPLDLLRRSLVCPDFLEQALVEGEAQQLSAADLGPSLSQLVKTPDAFVVWRDRPTVFDSTGFALEDVVVADLLLRHAAALGIGRRLAIHCLDGDPRDPYANLHVAPHIARELETGRRLP